MHVAPTRSGRERAGRAGRVKAAVVALATVSASFVANYSAAPPAAAANAACPWVDSTAPIPQRVSQLLAKMSVSQEVSMLTGVGGSSYVGFTPAIGSLCIPTINLQDGPAGRRRRLDRRHPAARAGLRRRHLRHLGRAGLRPGDRRRAGREGQHGRPRPDHQHRPRPALGPRLRVGRRGPVPQRHARRRRHPRRAVDRDDGPGQAPGRLQPGDQPQHPVRQRDRQHPGAAGDLPAGLRRPRSSTAPPRR